MLPTSSSSVTAVSAVRAVRSPRASIITPACAGETHSRVVVSLSRSVPPVDDRLRVTGAGHSKCPVVARP